MAQREGSVYLYLFIVAMILFVLATVAFIFKYNDAEKIAGDLRKSRAELEEVEEASKELGQEIRDLKRLIAGPSAENDYPRVAKMISDIRERNLTEAQTAINAALKDLGQSEKQFDALIKPYREFADIFKAYQSLRDDANTKRSESNERLTGLTASTEQAISQLRSDLRAKNDDLAEAQQRWEDAEQSKNAAVARLTSELEQKEEECTDEILRCKRIIQQKDNYINTLTILVETLQKQKQKEETFEDADPDGQLVDVSSELGKGWINLGRKQHLQSGLVFRVYQPIKGGKKLYKGRVEVAKVDETFSEVRIIEQTDPDSLPITAGDKVTSPFYDAKESPIFVLAGEGLQSRDITRDFLTAKLESYGVKVQPDVGIHTTYLVALEKFEQSTEYAEARRLGIPILREDEVLQFIGY